MNKKIIFTRIQTQSIGNIPQKKYFESIAKTIPTVPKTILAYPPKSISLILQNFKPEAAKRILFQIIIPNDKQKAIDTIKEMQIHDHIFLGKLLTKCDEQQAEFILKNLNLKN